MDTLTKLNVIGLVLVALLLAMACVKADWVRAWRTAINPSAEDLPDSFFVVARVIFIILAALGIYQCVQGFRVADGMSWSDSELTSAVRQATDDLDGYRYYADESGNSVYFDTYETLIEDKVVHHGGGDAPEDGVEATPADANTDTDAYFTVTADGADAAFCTHVKRTRSKQDDYAPPGITGGESTLTFPGYRLTVTTRKGAC
jgi:hypothetical protein